MILFNSANQFHPLPGSLLVPTLKKLSIGSFNGMFPEEVGRSNIASLSVYDSQLGSDFFSKLPSTLDYLFCESCKLQKIDNLVNPTTAFPILKTIALTRNSIEQIPDWFAALPVLERLNLASNSITSIPDSITASNSLSALLLSQNSIRVVPKSLSLMKNLVNLDLSENNLQEAVFENTPGGYPKLRDCKIFSALCSSIDSPAPSSCRLRACPKKSLLNECALLHDAATLIFTKNPVARINCCDGWQVKCSEDSILSIDFKSETFNFKEDARFPIQLTQLTQLNKLVMARHQMKGPLPVQVENWKNMTHLQLDGYICSWCDGEKSRRLNGTIPAGLFTDKLEYLHLGYNQFSGQLPSTLSNAIQLKQFILSGNKELQGPVFSSLVKVKGLTEIRLSNMNLNENVPESISELTSLLSLEAVNANLTGSLPASMGNLPLQTLDIAQNSLSGPFPNQVGQWSQLSSCSIRDTQMCIAGNGLPKRCEDQLRSNFCPTEAINQQCTTVASWFEANNQTSPYPKTGCCSARGITCNREGITSL
jgi:Leucine-rich repeat (LRR) protein